MLGKHLTTDPNDPRLGRGSDDTPVPQNEVYLVLDPKEAAKGYVQPYREQYVHRTCQAVTTMGSSIAATYARDPWFYGSTYCCACSKHRPLEEFTWRDGSEMSPHKWSEEQLNAVIKRKAELNAASTPP